MNVMLKSSFVTLKLNQLNLSPTTTTKYVSHGIKTRISRIVQGFFKVKFMFGEEKLLRDCQMCVMNSHTSLDWNVLRSCEIIYTNLLAKM